MFLGPAWPYRGGIATIIETLARVFQSGRTDDDGTEHPAAEVKVLTFSTQYPSILFPGKSQYRDGAKPADLEITRCVSTINPLNWLKVGRLIGRESPDAVVLKYWTPFMAPCFGTIARVAKWTAKMEAKRAARRQRKPWREHLSEQSPKCEKLQKRTLQQSDSVDDTFFREQKRTPKFLVQLDNIIPHERRWFDAPLTRYFVRSMDGFIYMSEEVGRDLAEFAEPDDVAARRMGEFGDGYVKCCDTKVKPRLYSPHPIFDHFGEKLSREEAARRLGLNPNVRYVMFFGLVRAYKGLDILLDAWAKMKRDKSEDDNLGGEQKRNVDERDNAKTYSLKMPEIAEKISVIAANNPCVSVIYGEAAESGNMTNRSSENAKTHTNIFAKTCDGNADGRPGFDDEKSEINGNPLEGNTKGGSGVVAGFESSRNTPEKQDENGERNKVACHRFVTEKRSKSISCGETYGGVIDGESRPDVIAGSPTGCGGENGEPSEVANRDCNTEMHCKPNTYKAISEGISSGEIGEKANLHMECGGGKGETANLPTGCGGESGEPSEVENHEANAKIRYKSNIYGVINEDLINGVTGEKTKSRPGIVAKSRPGVIAGSPTGCRGKMDEMGEKTNPHRRLIVAGEFYDDVDKYREQIARLGLDDEVIIADHFIPDGEIPLWFSLADLLVLPYRTATQSGVTQIAYHFDVPMVVTDVGGLPEIVRDGVAGYVCRPAPESVATAIEKFFEPGNAAALRANFPEEKKRFSWSAAAAALEKLYEMAVSRQ
jgi:glycosyltransferase involved in cell wall biosynthesis